MGSFWRQWRSRLGNPFSQSEEAIQAEIEQLRDRAPIPAIWLFGKTGSGKSSVIHYLTGAEAATIGAGYRPETKTSRRFDFPDAVEPLLTFIDTRGIGEAAYDPHEDLTKFADSTQAMIVTVRVADHALESVIEPLRRIRHASPHRPVLLALTCLHEAMGDEDVSEGPDPFAADSFAANSTSDSGASGTTDFASLARATRIPSRLAELLEEKQKQFRGLVDYVIPVDLTRPQDGFADPDFGGERLKGAILQHLPHAYRQALLSLSKSDRNFCSARQKRSQWQVLASSALAGTAGAIPVPWVDIPAVLAIQTHLAIRIAAIYEQEITPTHWAALSSAAGSRIALRMAFRSTLKLIPVVGMAANAASSFAFTYALGMSWDWYFADLRGGNVPSPERLKEVFADQLRRGHELWKAP